MATDKMNRIEGNWNQLKGKFKEKFGKLTDEDLAEVGGEPERLVGVLTQKYGMTRDKVEEQIENLIQGAETWSGECRDRAAAVYDRSRNYLSETSPISMAKDFRELASRYPIQTLLAGLGVGFLAGQVFGRVGRPSRRT